ncbi:MAG: VWA domain-containing protein [Planctomycetes bacterium]|nr:VWA domain-containing protein [Planctomycetota bacterium]
MTPEQIPGLPHWLWWSHRWALLLVLLLPLLWLLWTRPARRGVIRFSSLTALRASGLSWTRRARLMLPILRTLALICLIVTVARPQRPDQTSRIYTEGIAIQMVLDTSGSMLDTDLSPPGKRLSRLDVVKDVFKRFVLGQGELPGRTDDLIGMIRFAQYPDSVCPLTLDHDSLIDILQQTTIPVDRRGNVPQEYNATAIGDGLALAVERLKDLRRTVGSGEQLTITSRIVILLTDGENNAGFITPEQAGELAATYGIKVYTIMAGTGRGDRFRNRRPVDDSALREIAEKTGGRFFTARSAAALEQIYGQIDQLERTRTEERKFVRWGDLSHPWLLAAFIFISVQTLLDSTRLRKIP